MKKVFLALMGIMMSLCANAFEFDGIELNGNVVEVTRQISAKGYIYDDAKDCLKGNCQGTEIYLSINYADVKEKNRIGQLIVDVPMPEKDALNIVAKTFNVVYHQTAKTADSYSYAVSTDGTSLIVSKTKDGIRLTYNTPYYKAK